MPDRRRHWEDRYADPQRAAGRSSEFVLAALPPAAAGARALDVAAGDGRHAIALARRGYAVTAIDLAHAGLRRLRDAARREGLGVDVVQADLEAFPLPRNRYDVAVVTFYLQRDLFAPLAQSLVGGGLVIVETFLADQRHLGHPRNPAFLLERGELRDRFAGFEILACEEGLLETGGERAYLARLAARKPAASGHD